jgi:phosphate transport system protein
MDELRRDYHDRIAALRVRTGRLVVAAADAIEHLTGAFLARDVDAGRALVAELDWAVKEPTAVEEEVLDLLALQAPMARDLRVVLASLFIAQAADLCIGLARNLAGRVGSGDSVTTPTLRELSAEIGAQTVDLLRRANGAWTVLDEAQAVAVIQASGESRVLQRRFLAELLQLEHVPVEAAVDLGMEARAYERLTDHAVEIAGRVVFAATGGSPELGGAPLPE